VKHPIASYVRRAWFTDAAQVLVQQLPKASHVQAVQGLPSPTSIQKLLTRQELLY
jgi:hypothetical protein